MDNSDKRHSWRTVELAGEKYILDLDRLVYGFMDSYHDSRILIGSPCFTGRSEIATDGNMYHVSLNSWFPTFDVNAIPDAKLKDEILKRAMAFKEYASDYHRIDEDFRLSHGMCFEGRNSYKNECDRYLADSDGPIVLYLKTSRHIDLVYDGRKFSRVMKDEEWWNLVIPKEAIMFIDDDWHDVCTVNGIVSGFGGIQVMKMDSQIKEGFHDIG